jgi:hypothetical protein
VQIGENSLKRNLRGSKESQSEDPDFVEALNEDESGRQSSRRQGDRKTRQFCRQVQRALNLALPSRSVSDGATDLFVEEVLPAPDCGVWYDSRLAARLCDEEMVKVIRTLRPVLNYKGV